MHFARGSAAWIVLCVAREALISPCFPEKSANYPAKNTTREGFGSPGQRKTGNEKQHREPSPVFIHSNERASIIRLWDKEKDTPVHLNMELSANWIVGLLNEKDNGIR